MNRKLYMEELAAKLKRMPEQDRQDALAYYEEYFEEAGPESEEAIIKSLGTPSQVARQLMAEFAVKESKEKPESAKTGAWAILLIVLAVFASPIALPLAVAALAVVFALFVVVVSFVFTGVVVVASLLISGIGVLISAFPVFAVHMPTGIFFFGSGLVLVGISLILIVFMHFVIVKLTPYTVNGVHRLAKRLNRG